MRQVFSKHPRHTKNVLDNSKALMIPRVARQQIRLLSVAREQVRLLSVAREQVRLLSVARQQAIKFDIMRIVKRPAVAGRSKAPGLCSDHWVTTTRSSHNSLCVLYRWYRMLHSWQPLGMCRQILLNGKLSPLEVMLSGFSHSKRLEKKRNNPSIESTWSAQGEPFLFLAQMDLKMVLSPRRGLHSVGGLHFWHYRKYF